MSFYIIFLQEKITSLTCHITFLPLSWIYLKYSWLKYKKMPLIPTWGNLLKENFVEVHFMANSKLLSNLVPEQRGSTCIPFLFLSPLTFPHSNWRELNLVGPSRAQKLSKHKNLIIFTAQLNDWMSKWMNEWTNQWVSARVHECMSELCSVREVRLAGLADLHGLFAINFHNILENWAHIKGQRTSNVTSRVLLLL